MTHATDAIARELQKRVDEGKLELPLLPEVAAQVMALTSRADTDARALADLLRRDASFASHLLRVANSPSYASRSPIVSLQQAVSRLGLTTIRSIAIVISCETRAFQVRGREKEVRALFRHSLAAGLYAQEIARMRRLNVEEAFLAGLLHDVGRPTLLQAAADLIAELRLSDFDPAAVDALIGSLHERVGEALIARWTLPARLGLAVRHHHRPDGAGDAAPLASLVRLADDLSHVATGMRAVSEDEMRAHPMAAQLNLYPEDMEALLARKDEIVKQAEALA